MNSLSNAEINIIKVLGVIIFFYILLKNKKHTHVIISTLKSVETVLKNDISTTMAPLISELILKNDTKTTEPKL